MQLRGEAESFAIEAKAKAEAEQMAKKADAFKEYKDAAMVDMFLETLPKVIKILLYLYLRKDLIIFFLFCIFLPVISIFLDEKVISFGLMFFLFFCLFK